MEVTILPREIKFRAWDKWNKRMKHDPHEGDFIKWHAPSNWKECYEVMQYTGLKDRNGKEIYDGDICEFVILQVQKELKPIESLLVVIEWKNASWGFRHLYPDLVHEDDREWSSFIQSYGEMWDSDYFEIVGNIHEHPHLLKGEET